MYIWLYVKKGQIRRWFHRNLGPTIQMILGMAFLVAGYFTLAGLLYCASIKN